MLDKVFAGMKVSDLDTSAPPVRISRVNLRVDNETSYTAGDDSGRTIEKECPWGTQAMCDGILAQVRSVGYQPFSGVDCLLDPAAEVGDGITIGGVYSVLARTDITFDGLYTADPSAPGSDEVDDEYPYKSRASRLADRQRAQIYSRIIKTANMIRLEVVDEVRKLNARITLEVDRITTEVNDVNAGLSSKIEQTASSLTSQITNTANGLSSKIEQTASSLTAQISNTEAGLKNEIKVTADSLTEKISATDGRVTTLSTTVDGINVDVNGKDGKFSKLSQNVDGVSVRVGNAEGKITTVETTINGLTVTDTSGTTFISGSKIATKSITAEQLAVDALKTDRIYNKDGTKISIDCSDTRDLKIGGVDSELPYDKVSIRGKTILLSAWGKTNIGVEFQNYTDVCIRPVSNYTYDLGDSTHCWKFFYTNSIEVIPNGVSGGSKINGVGIIPRTSNQFLGNSTYRWAYFYAKNANVSGNLSMDTSSRIGFFGHAAMSKTIISTMIATTNTTALDVANKLNDLITALKNYGLI